MTKKKKKNYKKTTRKHYVGWTQIYKNVQTLANIPNIGDLLPSEKFKFEIETSVELWATPEIKMDIFDGVAR